MSEQNVQVTQALEPCLCGRPVNLFRFYERADEEGAHLNLDCSGFASDECPLGLSLTRDVQSEADVEAFIAAWNHRTRAEPDLVEVLNEAKKRWMLADGCLECNAADVAFWRRVVEFIEEVRRAALSRADGEGR